MKEERTIVENESVQKLKTLSETIEKLYSSIDEGYDKMCRVEEIIKGLSGENKTGTEKTK